MNPAGAPAFARVAFTNFPPWCFKDQNGRYQGILVDFLRDLSQDAGLTLREEDVPIARLHHSLSHGKLDLFVSKMPEGGFNCCASLGKAFDSEVVILGKNSGPGWDVNRTAGINICRTGLSGYNIPGFRMFDADSLDTCVRMVTHDRLPFVIGERHSMTMTMQRQKPEVSRLFSAPQVVEKKEFHLFISHSLDQTAFGPMIRKALLQRKISDYISRYLDSKP
jgi:ABC-type amino acid transport substrate-binding protein